MNGASCARELSPANPATPIPGEAVTGDDDALGDDYTSPAQPSPGVDFSVDSHPAERFMWPRFLSKLRETFSLDPQPSVEDHYISTVQQPQAIRPAALHPTAELQRLRKAVIAFPPRSIADFLITVCIEHGTDSFFYFDQAQFLVEIDQFYTDPASRLRSDAGFACLAHAAFALGSQWATLARPDDFLGSLSPGDGDPGRIFYNHARSLIPDIIDLPTLRAVQAPYVLGVYLLPASAIGSSYLYLGLALRKALALDLHLNTDDMTMPTEEKEIRSRLWWSIFSLERSSTVKLNRPRSIDASIISVPLPRPYPPLDSAQKFDNVQHQIADARLMRILDQVAEPREWSATTGNIPNDYRAKLKAWKRSLPACLRLENTPPKSSGYRAVFHLHLNYYFTWVAMGKVSVVNVIRSRLQSQFERGSQEILVDDSVGSLSRSCIKAAKKILQLFEELRWTGNLARFSFTDFQGCSIATVVLILSGILERDSSYERQVLFGLECLRKMADGNVTATMGVGFVEALQSIATEAVDKLRQGTARSEPGGAGDGPHMSDYHRWAEWLSKQRSRQDGVGVTPPIVQLPLPSPQLATPSSDSWPITQPNTTFTTWEGAAALQQLSVPSLADSGLNHQFQDRVQLAPVVDTDFLSTLYGDDHFFLMGLTGLEVLGFSE